MYSQGLNQYIFHHLDYGVVPKLKNYLNSPRIPLEMGPRQLVIYRGKLEDLANEEKANVQKVIKKQKLIIVVNNPF